MSEHAGDSPPRLIDITRAIADVQAELKSTPYTTHIQMIPYAIRDDSAQAAFVRGIEQHMSDSDDTQPCLLQGDHLQRGFTLGLYVTQQALGKGSISDMAKHVQDVMEHNSYTLHDYASYLGHIGNDTYAHRLSSDTQARSLSPSADPLHPFVHRYANELYGAHGFLQQISFKTGVGIARAAFNLYSRNLDIEIQGIEAASRGQNLQA